ncbi:MAG: MiaB/RimO family radical SAM methylthiotransferase, partial [Chloroflexota bacterium]|nr:MiaB/RimO family radical SAM methylthiotransferase [Chloroflexota bacterium]
MAGKKNSTASVAIETLGCKLNQAESESIALKLSEKGYRLVPASGRFDIYILNTCTVTHIADRKSRHLLRLARRRNPYAFMTAIGCYADRSFDELEKMSEIDLTLRNSDKDRLPAIIEEQRAPIASKKSGGEALRTRSMVKIQEGCDHFCAYCIVPYVRGRERSVPVEDILSEVSSRVSAGYREVVLTGTRIGSHRTGLPDLIRRILAVTGIERLRLSSLQPRDITDELLDLWSDGRLCRHIHLPLQSGSDPVLRRMGRPYSISEYERAVGRIREAIPGVSVTTDVIVGFPSESDDEFDESYDFCRRMFFSNIHVFPY